MKHAPQHRPQLAFGRLQALNPRYEGGQARGGGTRLALSNQTPDTQAERLCAE